MAGTDNLKARELYEQATACWKNKEYEKAVNLATQALELDPKYPDAYSRRGAAKADLGKFEEAIKDYDKAIRLDSNYSKAYNNRGIAKDKLGRHEEAITDYDEAIRLDSNDSTAYNNRGIAKFNLGKLEEAIKDYDEAIRLDPNLAEPYNNRGNAKIVLGKHKEGIKDFDAATRLDPYLPQPYFGRGEIYFNLNKPTPAKQNFESFIKFAGESLPAHVKLVKEYLGKLAAKKKPSKRAKIPAQPKKADAEPFSALSVKESSKTTSSDAVIFIDIVSSTDIMGLHGEKNFVDNIYGKLEEFIDSVPPEPKRIYKKGLGDGFMIVFKDTSVAIKSAISIIEKLQIHNSSQVVGNNNFSIRIGITYGETQCLPDGDRLGIPVNLASRLEGIDVFNKVHFAKSKNCKKPDLPEKNRIFIDEKAFNMFKNNCYGNNCEPTKCGVCRNIGEIKLKGRLETKYPVYMVDWEKALKKSQ